MDILPKEKPRFFGCGDDESRKAYRLVLESKVDCEIYLLSDVESPEIREGFTHYTGIKEIREFIEEYKNKISKQVTKKITIETIRYPIENDEYVTLKGLVSLLSFDMPVKDFNGKENKKLCLKTAWFTLGQQRGHYWRTWADGEDGCSICKSSSFNELNEDFSSYSKERLEEWQNIGIKKHRKYLLKVEDLYWRGERIPKDFL